ncbi:inner membrane-spanning protein YciB [Jannaschia helgolandensis]|jgi:intracellular septation protein|uniref:inner membrane-spanning protein YciB n=1 Tax=Jannaschia helgolandensis TaxID=188906 RepID=UPI0030D95BFB|tara:strand:- start:498 stop:1106 length:609 start_codon:yes stop_codon:yes gene_type:complete
MTDRQTPGWVKPSLELGPVALFFLGYIYLKDETFTVGGTEYAGFIVVTALFIPLILASTAALWWLTGKLSQMQIVTAVLVTVFGGLSVWLNDERFFKMKPTLIYLLFAAVFFFGLWRGRSYLAMVLSETLPLTHEGWMLLTKRMAWFFVGLAVANEVIWRTMSTDAWVSFKTFGLPVAMFAFFIAQAGLLKAHTPEEKVEEE